MERLGSAASTVPRLTPEAEDAVAPLSASFGSLSAGRTPEIKRSSWYAGMPGPGPLPMPGSPASWNLPAPVRPSTDEVRGRLSPVPRINIETPPRGPSPNRSPVLRSSSPVRNPFNFEPTFVSASPARPSQRRGHRYKQSSVSMNFFQEPEARAPLAIPVSLAIPTFRESWQSVTRDQALQLGWCGLRVFVVLLLFTSSTHTIHSVSALAHWAAYDVVVATTLACVQVLSNFDVWTQSSLRLPFALQRTEVLAGFALAITLIFIGFDTVSHTIQDLAELVYGGDGAHGHGHGGHGLEGRDGTASALVRIALALVTTLLSLVPGGLANAWSVNRISSVTVLFCGMVLSLPLLGPLQPIVDELLTPTMAAAMVYFGWQAAKQFGGMLVMSHDSRDLSTEIAAAVDTDPNVASVSDVSLWRVHHDLWLASMKVFMTGSDADEKRVRDNATMAVRKLMGEEPGVRWETTIDISRTTLD